MEGEGKGGGGEGCRGGCGVHVWGVGFRGGCGRSGVREGKGRVGGGSDVQTQDLF